MIINKILYFLLIIVSAFFYLLYIDNLSFFILVFIIVLPAALGLMLIIFKLTVKLDIEAKSCAVSKRERIIFSAVIKNRTYFSFSNSLMTIEYFNKLSGTSEIMTVSIPIHSKCTEKIEIGLSSDYCGIIEARIKSLKVYDCIKLFLCRIKSESTASVYVMPEIHEIKSSCNVRSMEAYDSEIYSKYKSGDDPSEIFDLKEYSVGDKLNRIHWNLSLRLDKFISRHYSQPINSSVLIAVDYMKIPETHNLQLLDSIMETAATISAFLISNESFHNWVFYNKSTGSFETCVITCLEELQEAVMKMYKTGAYKGEAEFPEYINGGRSEYSKIIYITSNDDFDFINEDSDNSVSAVLISENIENYKKLRSECSYISVIQTGKVAECIDNIYL